MLILAAIRTVTTRFKRLIIDKPKELIFEDAYTANTKNTKRQRLELVHTSQRMAFVCDKKMSHLASTECRGKHCCG